MNLKKSPWLSIFIALFAILAGVVIWATLKVPTWARDKAAVELTSLLGRTVTVGQVDIGLFPLRATVSNFNVLQANGSGSTLVLESLAAQIDWRSFTAGHPIVSSVSIVKPEINLTRFADGKTSVDDLIEKFEKRPKSDKLAEFSVANITLQGGAIRVTDDSVKSTHAVTELNAQLPFISSLPVNQKIWIKPELSFKLDGKSIVGEAQSLPFDGSRKSRLNIIIDPFELEPWLAYWPKTAVIAPKAARLQSKLAIDFEQSSKNSLLIKGQIEVEKIGLHQAIPTKVFEKLDVTIGNVKIESFEFEPIARKFKANGIVVREPSVDMTRPSSLAVTQAKTAVDVPSTFDWQLGDIKIIGGSASYQDPLFAPKALSIKLKSVDGTLAGLGIASDVPVQVTATAVADHGEQLKLEGSFNKSGGPSQLAWDVDKASLSQWWWFIEPFLVSTPKGGALRTKGRVFFGGDQLVKIDQLSAAVTDFSLRSKSGLEWFKLKSIEIDNVALDLAAKTVAVGSIKSNRMQVYATRNAQNELSFSELVPAKKAVVVQPNATSLPAKAAWNVALGELTLASGLFDLHDEAKAKDDRRSRGSNKDSKKDNTKQDTDLRLDDIKLLAKGLVLNTESSFTKAAAEKFATEKLAKPVSAGSIEITAALNQRGKFALKGPLQLQPFSTQAQLDVSGASVLPFQAYFAEYVNAVATSGDVSAKGQLSLNLASANTFQYQGSLGVNQFAAVTKEANEDLLKWKSLYLSRVQFATLPLNVDLGDIAITDFYSRLIINSTGRFNLQDLMARTENPSIDSEAQVTPPVPPERLPVRIGIITLNNGNIDFSDFFVKPNYSANLTSMSGTITELTPEKPGQVSLSGRVDGTGNLSIEGSLNPLIRNLFIDLKADARDIDLPRLTPYSGKYIGYGIEKGKLSAKVSYKLENRQLQAENRVILDQLTFGEKVESPTAMKLPILFAVALLKDRNGVIDINMPIGGSLDDPQFSISGLVFRMIGNLIVKVITSPFTLLASLGGGKQQELSQVEFEVGRASLSKTATEKAESIAKALSDRPALKLDIAGRANPKDDVAMLKKLAFDRLLKVQKMRETIKGNVSVDEVDAVEITPAEYPKYLNQAYQASSAPKQRNLIGIQKTLPLAEIEKLLGEIVTVSDAEIVNLANKRAQALKDWLVEIGKISAERLFIVAPKMEGAPRVELSLK